MTEKPDPLDLRDYGKLSLAEAREIQKRLRQMVSLVDKPVEIRTVGGCDLGVLRRDRKLVSGVLVFTYPDLEEIERAFSVERESFPYVPGFLSFREGPAILSAWDKLSHKPDLLMLDGQGIAHPRGLGIASHIGLALDVPSIGVAKKRLFGIYEEPPPEAGALSYLTHPDSKEVIGAVLRTRAAVKPVFVSPGHGVSLDRAIEITRACARGYRLPEPTRAAHGYVGELTRGIKIGEHPGGD